MVMRRLPGSDSQFDGGDFGDEKDPFAKIVNLFDGVGGDTPGQDAMPNDFGVYPPGKSPAEAIGAVREDPNAGNNDRPRDIFGDNGPRTFAPPSLAPASSESPAPSASGGDTNPANSLSDIVSLLPQGVEASGQGSTSAPMSPQSPADQSVTMRATPPANGAGGPARQPFTSPSAIYGSQSSHGLVGRNEGLFGGGIGMPGGPAGGPHATQLMLDLVKRLSGQG